MPRFRALNSLCSSVFCFCFVEKLFAGFLAGRGECSFQWAGGFVLLLVSAWFVDMSIMFVRVLMFCRRRVVQRGRGVYEKLRLPLWAFPLMWAITFVVLVSVASVQGTKDPVTRTIEVSTGLFVS